MTWRENIERVREALVRLRDWGTLSHKPTVEAIAALDALTAQIEELEEPIRDFLLQWERHSSEQDDFVVDAVFGLRAALAQSDPPEDSE